MLRWILMWSVAPPAFCLIAGPAQATGAGGGWSPGAFHRQLSTGYLVKKAETVVHYMEAPVNSYTRLSSIMQLWPPSVQAASQTETLTKENYSTDSLPQSLQLRSNPTGCLTPHAEDQTALVGLCCASLPAGLTWRATGTKRTLRSSNEQEQEKNGL